jgi:hypothetical protein
MINRSFVVVVVVVFFFLSMVVVGGRAGALSGSTTTFDTGSVVFGFLVARQYTPGESNAVLLLKLQKSSMGVGMTTLLKWQCLAGFNDLIFFGLVLLLLLLLLPQYAPVGWLRPLGEDGMMVVIPGSKMAQASLATNLVLPTRRVLSRGTSCNMDWQATVQLELSFCTSATYRGNPSNVLPVKVTPESMTGIRRMALLSFGVCKTK